LRQNNGAVSSALPIMTEENKLSESAPGSSHDQARLRMGQKDEVLNSPWAFEKCCNLSRRPKSNNTKYSLTTSSLLGILIIPHLDHKIKVTLLAMLVIMRKRMITIPVKFIEHLTYVWY
jgi:hypothetical protein